MRDRRSKHPLYQRWANWMRWCYDPNDVKYRLYGGRGARVAKSWHDFWQFAQDMEHIPRPQGCDILDRKDNTRPYSRTNIRWCTTRTNHWDRYNNMSIKIGRRTQCLAAWCHELNLNSTTVWSRIRDLGWTPRQALNIDPR